jgi:hypothetical protein
VEIIRDGKFNFFWCAQSGVRSTVNEWLILRTLCFFSTCNKHNRHAGIIPNIGHKKGPAARLSARS